MTTAPTSTRREALLTALRGRLVVSCQARPGEPLHGPEHMRALALSVVAGGAAAVRVGGPDDVAAVSAAVVVPVVGLWKDGNDGVYITPTLEHALAIHSAGASVVALDGTGRPRPDGRTLAEVVGALHDAGALVMADVSTCAEGVAAADAGADLVATTLSGYTPWSRQQPGPDLDLVGELAAELSVPVVAEGRIGTPAQAAEAVARGAWCVVVGGAITRPASIAAGFAAALPAARPGGGAA